MKNIFGILLAVVFAILSLLHIYWAFGGRGVGSGSVIPSVEGKPVFEPSALTTLLVAAALLTAMLVVLGQLGFLGETVPKWIFRWATLGISAVFFLRAIGEFKLVGIFKQIRDTPFAYWDTWLFTPLCLLIAVTALMLAWKRD